MKSLRASVKKANSPFGGKVRLIGMVGIAAGLVFASLPAGAAQSVPPQRPSAKVEKRGTDVAAKDAEQTGSIQAGDVDISTCDRSRKRLFVKGEGWIVRRVTTCY